MPAVKRITKEAIINAAVDVLREGGFTAVNARSVAKKLGCSTQPIYLSFNNMEELKAEITKRAVEMHEKRVREFMRVHEGGNGRYSSYGMGFVQFAAQEKQLFRWLYLEGGQRGKFRNDMLHSEVISTIVTELGYDEQTAEKFHQDMTYYSYGLAILANTGHLYLTESELREAFRREFHSLTAYYGTPPRML